MGGSGAANCIGAGNGSTSCGTVTIGGVEYYDGAGYKNEGANYIGQHTLYFLKGNEGEKGQYWTTYYDNTTNLLASEGTQVFKAGLDGINLTLTPISDRIIN